MARKFSWPRIGEETHAVYEWVLGAEMPVVLSREVYVTAALCGAALFVASSLAGLPREVSILLGFCAGLLVRGAALHWGWSLPRYRGRPGRTLDEIKRLD